MTIRLSATLPLLTLALAACSHLALPDEPPTATAAAAPTPAPLMRPPTVGQQWVYQVRNRYNGLIVDQLTETVTEIVPQIRIQRFSERDGPLEDEVHETWGGLIQDSLWSPALHFDAPVPVWPSTLSVDAVQHTHAHYTTAADAWTPRFWDATLRAQGWASITVPAGRFTTLHISRHIEYLSDNALQLFGSERQEEIWLAPELGRWVLRRAQGFHYNGGRGSKELGDSVQLELKRWR